MVRECIEVAFEQVPPYNIPTSVAAPAGGSNPSLSNGVNGNGYTGSNAANGGEQHQYAGGVAQFWGAEGVGEAGAPEGDVGAQFWGEGGGVGQEVRVGHDGSVKQQMLIPDEWVGSVSNIYIYIYINIYIQ
jgi:hypothetical protein